MAAGMPGIGSSYERVFPEQESLTADQWAAIARFLFDMLDNVDTADDMAKSDDRVYRRLASQIQGRRFEVGDTDGRRIVFRCPDHILTGRY